MKMVKLDVNELRAVAVEPVARAMSRGRVGMI